MWQSSVKDGAVLVGQHPLDRFIGSLSSAALERPCLQVPALTQAFVVILAGGLAKSIYLTRCFAVLGTESYVNALRGEFEKMAPHAECDPI